MVDELKSNIKEGCGLKGRPSGACAGSAKPCCSGTQVVNIPELKTANIIPPATDYQFNLKKLYIEPTNRCNLDCRTCMRNSWDEPMGNMSEDAFRHILDGLKTFSPVPEVFFGGFGEPLFHPRIVEMVSEAKKIGATVKLITNGILLTPVMAQNLLDTGIDLIWISIDGATPESYADIRLGASLPQVIENVTRFNEIILSTSSIACCAFIPKYKTKLGITFVAMKRNIADLPAVLKLGRRLNVERFLVTNILPYTEEMQDEILYANLTDSYGHPSLTLPRIDPNFLSLDALYREVDTVNWLDSLPQDNLNHCPFIDNDCGAISWDGGFSPCLALLHTNGTYVRDIKHVSKRWTIGRIQDQSLPKLWFAPEHLAFRDRVKKFDFAPCTNCGSCDLFEYNEEDCYGNAFPVCGGCLWAQGIVRCP
ncbi:MAG: putative oxidoreductase [Firmicutes bacterium]|nr:putative oxidoreductase [Bacillota bacterium]